MEIRIDPHTLEHAKERGADEVEITDVINSGASIPAKQGRVAKARVYSFNQTWQGKHYEQKRVEVIYTLENNIAVTVTVYVFYGTWED